MYLCRFAVSCSYSGVGGFESSTSTIDVVADVKSEKVCAHFPFFDDFDIHFRGVLFKNVIAFICLVVDCSIGRQWVCWFCHMQGSGFQGHRSHKRKQVCETLN